MLRIFHLVVKRFSEGEKPLTLFQIADTLETPIRLVREILSGMIEVGLVAEITRENSHEVAYQPGRPIEQLTIQSVLDLYEKRGERGFPADLSGDAEKIAGHLREISETIERSPANVRLKEI